LLAACRIDVAYDGTMYQCPDGRCPPGYTCQDGQCVKGGGTDADAMSRPDATPGVPDAAPDAATPPDPTAGNVLFFTFEGDLPQMSIVRDRGPHHLDAGRAGGGATAGRYGNGYALDDGDETPAAVSHLRVPDSPRLSLGNQLTIEAWVSLDELQNQVIFGDFLAGTAPEVEYSFELTGPGGLAFYTTSCPGGTTEMAATSGGAIPLATFTHVAVTWDGSDARFYIDGALIATVPFAHTPCESNGLREWRIGRRIGGANAFDGVIDELKVSSYPKTAAEIQMSASFDSLAAGSVCGDGLIEGDEQCDGSSACCNAGACALADDGVPCNGGVCQQGACDSGGGRVDLGLLALYPFDEGTGNTVTDQSGVTPALDLVIADPASVTWGPGTLTLDASTVVQSAAAAGKIANACRASDELTVEAWVAPANTTQEGPSRIVTMSIDSAQRNFTLGQEGDAFILRVRSTAAGDNGEPLAHTPAGDVVTSLTHLVATRSADGARRMYVDGTLRTQNRVEGDFSTWDATWNFGLGNELNPAVDRTWLGTFHLVAVYCRALSGPEVAQNFFAGPDPQQ
jgi:hypothetical protein